MFMSLGNILDKKLQFLDNFFKPKSSFIVNKPKAIKCADGSNLIEWITKDCRFGISLELEPSESSWYFVSKCHKSMGDCGELPKELQREKLVLSCCDKKWPVTYKFCPECGKVLKK
jgi:hypothetical protein